MRSAVKSLVKRLLPPGAIRFLKAKIGSPQTTAVPAAAQLESDTAVSSKSVGYVRFLEDRLGVGYIDEATAKLHSVIENSAESQTVRTAAAIALARWEMRHDRLDSALDYLAGLTTDLTAASLAADCLCWLGHGQRALAHLSAILDRGDATASTTIRVGSARSLIEGDRQYGSGWLITELNRLYLDEGLAPVSRRSVHDPSRVGNLMATAPRYQPQDAAHLISVIVPTFNCAETIEASIESLLNQSWDALEVIVVDAASSDGTTEIVNRLADSDPRLRILEVPEAGRTFEAVNLGVQEATGEFVTIQNGLDWSHPQRIEAQAMPLLGNDEVAASGVFFMAVGIEDFLHRPPRSVPEETLVARDFRSVMYRLATLDRIGLWDQVNELADEEHVRRLQAVVGEEGITWMDPDVPVVLRGVQATGRASTSNVTEGGLSRMALYRNAYQWWHRSSRLEHDLPFRPNAGRHPFAPWASEWSETAEPMTLTAIIVGDLSHSKAVAERILGLIGRHPGRVGVVHIPGFDEGDREMLPDLYAKVAEGDLILVGVDTVVQADVVILTESVIESPPIRSMPAIHSPEAYILTDDGREVNSAIPAEWQGVPLLGAMEPETLMVR